MAKFPSWIIKCQQKIYPRIRLRSISQFVLGARRKKRLEIEFESRCDRFRVKGNHQSYCQASHNKRALKCTRYFQAFSLLPGSTPNEGSRANDRAADGPHEGSTGTAHNHRDGAQPQGGSGKSDGSAAAVAKEKISLETKRQQPCGKHIKHKAAGAHKNGIGTIKQRPGNWGGAVILRKPTDVLLNYRRIQESMSHHRLNNPQAGYDNGNRQAEFEKLPDVLLGLHQ